MRRLSLIVMVVLLLVGARCEAGVLRQTFQSSGRKVQYEVFESASPDAPLLILLHGASGPETAFYRSQAGFFARNGYQVLLLHYFDSDRSREPSDRTYRIWGQALADLVRECGLVVSLTGRPIFVLGDSLGASVALAAGSQGLPVKAIAEWYGSLPDDAFYHFKTMPPLLILHGARDNNIPVVNAQQLIRLCTMRQLECASHLYPDQGHGFAGEALRDAEGRTLSFFKDHLRPVTAP